MKLIKNVTTIGIKKIGIIGAIVFGTFQVIIHLTKYPTLGPINNAPKNPAETFGSKPAIG